MDGYTLEKILKSDPAIAAVYMGIYSINSIWPEPVSLPACYVINTDKYDGPGEHWVSFYMDENRTADFFDSYGTVPLESIYKWLHTHGMDVVKYNTKWLQSPFTTVCWAYCIYFLHMRCRRMPMDYIVASFDSYDFLKNDMLVLSMVDI